MGHIPDRIARVQNITYTDEWNRPAILSSDELAFFAETVSKVLAATGISIDVCAITRKYPATLTRWASTTATPQAMSLLPSTIISFMSGMGPRCWAASA